MPDEWRLRRADGLAEALAAEIARPSAASILDSSRLELLVEGGTLTTRIGGTGVDAVRSRVAALRDWIGLVRRRVARLVAEVAALVDTTLVSTWVASRLQALGALPPG